MKKTTFVCAVLISTNLFASGLSKPVQVGPKAIGMGGAFVGVADDATAIYHNPAGITQIESDHSIQAGADILFAGKQDYTPPGGTAEKIDREFIPVPQFGYVNNQLKILSFGLGVFFPHGNGAKYSTASATPGNPLEGRIFSMEISPTVAWQVIPELSIGASLRVTRISTSLQGQLIPPPLLPALDTLENLETSGWGYGAAAGVLAKPLDWLRIGVNYRSKIKKDLGGDGTFTNIGDFDATFEDFVLPTLVTAGFSAQVLDELLLSFQYGWERNSEIENFLINSPSLGNITLPQNWQDSHTFQFGAKYDVCKMASLLAGYSKDFNDSLPDTVMNRITGDIAAHDVTAGIIANFGKVNAGLSWNGRFGTRNIPVDGTNNPAPGEYDAFIHTISTSVGVNL